MIKDHSRAGFEFSISKGLSLGAYVPIPEHIHFFATPGIGISDPEPFGSLRPTKEEVAHFMVVSGTFAHQFMINNFVFNRPLGADKFKNLVESSFSGLDLKTKDAGSFDDLLENLSGVVLDRGKFHDQHVIRSLDKLTNLALSSVERDALTNYMNVHIGITKCILDTKLKTKNIENIPNYSEVLKYLENEIEKVSLDNTNIFEFFFTVKKILNSSNKYICVNNAEAHQATYNLLATCYWCCLLNKAKLPEILVSLLNIYQPALLVPIINLVQDIETKEFKKEFFELHLDYIPIPVEVLSSVKECCLIENIKAKFLEKVKPYSDCMHMIGTKSEDKIKDKYGIDKYMELVFKGYDQVFSDILEFLFRTLFEIESTLKHKVLDCEYCRLCFDIKNTGVDSAIRAGIQKQYITKTFKKNYKENIRKTLEVYASQYKELTKYYPWGEATVDEKFITLGNKSQREGKYREAVSYYDKALEANPDSFRAWYNRAHALSILGKDSEALKCMKKALEINPKHENAWISMAAFLGKERKHQEALRCIDKALALNPNSKAGKVLKGMTLEWKNILENLKIGAEKHDEGKYDDAIIWFDKILKNKTKEKKPEYARIWFLKGDCLGNLGKHWEEIECYNQALNIDPNYFEALYKKAIALSILKRFDEAIECCDKVLEIDPVFNDAWMSKGDFLYNIGRFTDAIECFDKVLEINPRDPDAWKHKGFALYRLGLYRDVANCFDKVLEMRPDDEDIRRIKR